MRVIDGTGGVHDEMVVAEPRAVRVQEHLDGIVTLARQLPGIQGVEILPYFDLWRAKLARFGLTSRLPESVKPPDRATVKSWEEYLGAHGLRVVS